MYTHRCGRCLTIWCDTAASGQCPNCRSVSARPDAELKTLTLRLYHEARQWRIEIREKSGIFSQAWETKPSASDIASRVAEALESLWEE
ncbi:MAG: hypothetical protein AB7S65_11325 [Sulfuricurvum sp.]